MLTKLALAAATAATVAALTPPAHAIDPVCGVLRMVNNVHQPPFVDIQNGDVYVLGQQVRDCPPFDG
jgi:hypothetical protein